MPDAIYVEGISSITPADLDAADELGYRIKLLGVAVKTEKGIEQRVHPTMVPKDSAIAQVMGVTNAVTVDADGIAPITLVGPGRRRHGDRVGGGLRHRRHRPRRAHRAVRPAGGAAHGEPKAPMQRHEGGYYIRLLARRQAGHRRHHRHAGSPSSTFRWNRSCSATAARGRMAATIRKAAGARCRSS